jgi:Holliday junction resolvase RusA-like endonuclease
VRLYSKGRSVSGKEYGVRIGIYLGAKQKGDLDNFAKVCLDSLVKCGVIDSDAKVVELYMFKYRDRKNPRTEISVWDTGA